MVMLGGGCANGPLRADDAPLGTAPTTPGPTDLIVSRLRFGPSPLTATTSPAGPALGQTDIVATSKCRQNKGQ